VVFFGRSPSAKARRFGKIPRKDRNSDEASHGDYAQESEDPGFAGKAEAEMMVNLLPSIFTIEIGDTPTLVFEVQNLREAHELCREQWLKGDLAEAKCNGVPLWDGKAKLRARLALSDEIALFAEAKNTGELSDGLMLVYLVEMDGEATDDEALSPGEFSPTRS
jgi:hypothetical protein